MTHVVSHRGILSGTLLLALAASAGAQVTAGYTQDFQGGTTAGWAVAGGPVGAISPTPPLNVAGGRLGATDLFLQLSSTGRPESGGRLAPHNRSGAWTGDYRAAGISAVEMWVNNFGTSDLALRLGFTALLGGTPYTALSLTPFFVPGGSGWMPLSFSLAPGALGALPGSDLETVMRNVFEIRLMHAPDFASPAPTVAALLGVDDMRIVGGATLPPPTAVPEPATVVLLGTGLLTLAVAGRRRRR